MRVYLAGVLQFYEGLSMELLGGGTGDYFVTNGNYNTRKFYEDILSRGERQRQDNTCPEGGARTNKYLFRSVRCKFLAGGGVKALGT